MQRGTTNVHINKTN